MSSVAPKSKTVQVASIEQMRATLTKAWLEQEQERLSQLFLAALKAVMIHCEQLQQELNSQQQLEQQAAAALTLADKLRLKLGTPLSSPRMSAAAQQLANLRTRIAQLHEEIALNSPGAKPPDSGQSSMLASAIARNDAAVKRLFAPANPERAAWIEGQLHRQLLEEHKQHAHPRKPSQLDAACRKSLRSAIGLNVNIQGQHRTVTGITRDISDTGVFVELPDANQAFSEGELLTVQVSDLPSEATVVRGMAVRVGAHGLGVQLLPGEKTLPRPPKPTLE